jgi:leucine dehydrogenase
MSSAWPVAKVRYGTDSLSNKTVSVQGCGHVGYYLCRLLHDEGSKLIVTDIDDEKIKRIVDEFGARAVDHNEIYGVDADIFAPCALGAIVNDDTIGELKVSTMIRLESSRSISSQVPPTINWRRIATATC